MAPKKNKQREKQEQNRASSSARAHERLLASLDGGAAAAAPAFVGFSSFAPQPTIYPAKEAARSAGDGAGYSAAPAANMFYDGPDHDIAMALKMLGKKGTVTKIKALHSLLQDALPPKKPADIRGMVGHFVHAYTAEMRDQNDRKVRQLLNEVLRVLADKLRPKAFAAHLKRLLPYWFMAMHDVNGDVAAVASQAFQVLLPEDESRLAVVEEHLDAIMEEYQGFLGKTPDTFDGVSMQPDEREERWVPFSCSLSIAECVRALILSMPAATASDTSAACRRRC